MMTNWPSLGVRVCLALMAHGAVLHANGIGAEPSSTAQQTFILFDQGQQLAQLVIPDEPTEAEWYAVEELLAHLQMITSQSWAATPASEIDADRPAILLGSVEANQSLRDAMAEQGMRPESTTVRVEGDRLHLVGRGGTGTVYAVYEFLERLGVRWLMPGAYGTYAPRLETIAVDASINRVYQSPFKERSLSGIGGEWSVRQRLSAPGVPGAAGERAISAGGAHSYFKLVPPAEYFEEHPEYYHVVNGKPVQLRLFNDEVVEIAAEHGIEIIRRLVEQGHPPETIRLPVGPEDIHGFSPEDVKRGPSHWDHTDIVLQFANRVAERVHEVYPQAQVFYYVYSTYQKPPTNVKVGPTISPEFTMWGTNLETAEDMLKPIRHPNNAYIYKCLSEWSKLTGHLYLHPYWSTYGNYEYLPTSVVADLIRFASDIGVHGFRGETYDHWGMHNLTLYVTARMMWEPTLDHDELVADYCQAAFGPGAEEMGRFYRVVEQAAAQHPDKVIRRWDSKTMSQMLTPEVMGRLKRLIDLALVKAGDDPQAHARLAHLRKGYDYVERRIALGRVVWRMSEDKDFDPDTPEIRKLVEQQEAATKAMGDAQGLPIVDPYLINHEKNLTLGNVKVIRKAWEK